MVYQCKDCRSEWHKGYLQNGKCRECGGEVLLIEKREQPTPHKAKVKGPQ